MKPNSRLTGYSVHGNVSGIQLVGYSDDLIFRWSSAQLSNDMSTGFILTNNTVLKT